MEILRLLDLSGVEINLNIRGNLKIKTVLGGLFTIILTIIFIILFYFLGKNFYHRENPILTESIEKPPNYFNYTLNSSSFLFAFRLFTPDGKTFLSPDKFYIETRYMVYKNIKNEGTSLVNNLILSYHKCTLKDLNNNDIYNVLSLQDWYCIDWPEEGLTVGGFYSYDLVQFLKIKLIHCEKASKEYLKINNITCSKDGDNILQLLRNTLYFEVNIQTYAVDSDKYDDPFTLRFNPLYDSIDQNFSKKVYYYMKVGVLNDDKGWISDNKQKTTLYGLDRVKYDYLSSNDNVYDRKYFESTFYFDNIIEKYERKYTKIQDILASLGGLIKSFSLFFSMFLQLYNNYNRDINIINKSFDFYNKPILSKSKITYDKANKTFGDSKENSNRALMNHLNVDNFNENLKKQIRVLFKNKRKLEDKKENTEYDTKIAIKTTFIKFLCLYFNINKKFRNKQFSILKESYRIIIQRLDVINIINDSFKLETLIESIFDREGIKKLNMNKKLFISEENQINLN